MHNAENVGLVYGSTTYWLASSCVTAEFFGGFAGFDVRCVSPTLVYSSGTFLSNGVEGSTSIIRPVVSLSSNVTLTKESTGIWKIN